MKEITHEIIELQMDVTKLTRDINERIFSLVSSENGPDRTIEVLSALTDLKSYLSYYLEVLEATK